MVRRRLFSVLLAAVFGTLGCFVLAAQVRNSRGKTWTVPPAVAPRPFTVAPGRSQAARSIELRPPSLMKPNDRLLAADAESSIAEHIRWNGFSLNEGRWSYQEVVCPALPGHLFLQYTRNNGVGDVSVFSASIPRNGEGRVRIIPILKRSYSLFAPAPINALTISAFNHIRAEEPGGSANDWLGNGLCYAVLAGAHPVIASPDAEPTLHKPVPALTAMLVVPEKGGEVIKFADEAATPRPMEWTMTFNRKGKLVKAAHFAAPMNAVQPASRKSGVGKTWTIVQASQP